MVIENILASIFFAPFIVGAYYIGKVIFIWGNKPITFVDSETFGEYDEEGQTTYVQKDGNVRID